MSNSSFYTQPCKICPRSCGAFRQTQSGFCGVSSEVEVAWSGLHWGEEPPISAIEGSGTVFFCGCHLGCLYCQNQQISHSHQKGRVYSQKELRELFLQIEASGAENLNLVSGTHYLPSILEALKGARRAGLSIPIVWNSSGYETLESVELLGEVVDIFLPDLKSLNPQRSFEFLGAKDYPQVAVAAIKAMCQKKPPLTTTLFNHRLGYEHPLMKKGVIVRHLVLPHCLEDSIAVIDFYEKELRPLGAFFSLITDFLPGPHLPFPLNQTLSIKEKNEIIEYLLSKVKGDEIFFQENEESTEEWRPDFTQERPFPLDYCRPLS